METIVQDLRYGLQQLHKNPGFTAIAVLTLALGIAVNATMFSLVSAFLLRRPPGRDPERVAVVTSVDPAQGYQADASPVSVPNYLAWRDTNHVFADMAADESRTVSLSLPRQPEAIGAAAVSANYFSVLGVTPRLGRTFEVGEDQARTRSCRHAQPGDLGAALRFRGFHCQPFRSLEPGTLHSDRCNAGQFPDDGLHPGSVDTARVERCGSDRSHLLIE
ncbi:MAG: ABC transporter permease [Candidatus Sulfotelmatobacter sp.]